MSSLKLVIALAATAMLASCGSVDSRFRIKNSDKLPITKGEILQVSKIAEYRVEPTKIVGSYTGKYERKTSNRSIDLAKELAIGDAVSKAKCDFLIGPIHDVNVEGQTITVMVSGYPAHYIDFATQIISDSLKIVTNERVLVPTSNQTPNYDQAKKKTRRRKLRRAAIIYVTTSVLLGLTLAVANR